MQPQIYIAYTGGTIGMGPTDDGYAPIRGYLGEHLANLPDLHLPGMPSFQLHEFEPLLDSSNIIPADWTAIAKDIADHYDHYDGFIVLHGTDTMAYTASALSFILRGLAKPVILTGSQIPLNEMRSDGRQNLITALLIAANHPIPEVCVYFHDKLLRGCRTVKVDAEGFDAFDSPNFPPLGEIGVDIQINWRRVRKPPPADTRLTVDRLGEASVGALRLFPGISARVLANILQPPLQGLVLEVYGVGNAPDRDPEFLDVLAEATGRGVVIVACTQCLRGTVDLRDYSTGAALSKAGVIGGYDITGEAMLAKLIYLFGAGYSPADVKTKISQNLRGEISLPTAAQPSSEF